VSENEIPAAATGFTYRDPVLAPDPATVTIARAGQLVTIEARNVLDADVTPVEPGQLPGTGPSGLLPVAGPAAVVVPDAGGPPLVALLVGFGLVFAGTLLLLRSGLGRPDARGTPPLSGRSQPSARRD
jgi:hypothetical protein